MAVTLSISIKQNSQSVSNNSSNVTVTVACQWTYGSFNRTQKSGSLTIDGTKYSFTSSFNAAETTSGGQTLFTKTLDIKHADNGKKTLACIASYVTGVSSGTITASKSLTLDAISRRSTMTFSDGTLGVAQTLKVNRQSSSFTHTITATCGTASTTIVTKSSSTSISFTPPIEWASQNTTGTSVSVVYKITTYSGSTSIGTAQGTRTCAIPDSVKPSCSIAVSDPEGYLETYGSYIKGLSKFKVTVTPTISYGSGIASYKTTANGATYTAASFTTGVLSSSGTLTVSATVTDGRSRTGLASKNLTVVSYNAPVVNSLAVRRCNEDGTANDQGEFAKVTYTYTATSLNSKNACSCVLKYKKSSASSYTSVTLSSAYSVSGGTKIFPADSGSSYDVILTVSDSLNEISRHTSVSTGFTLMHWNANGKGMGIGKLSEEDDVLDIAMTVRARNGLQIPDINGAMFGLTDSALFRQRPTVPEGTDFNTYITPGIALVPNGTYSNIPFTGGFIIVFPLGASSATCVQILINSTGASRKIRTIWYGTAYEWRDL